ncbi:MAG: MATE family efflux transporter [Clostridiales bacterium]|nr:MATE family efflux transporter [Clostridiales bacterium]
MILQNLITSSAGLVDTMMVGTLGQDSLSGVSLANTPFFVAMLFVFGLQSGGSVLISQYWGKNDARTVNRVMGISWYFACIISTLFAAVVFFFPEQVMSITTDKPELLEVAVRYGRVVAFSFALNSFTTVFTGALRSCEHPLFGTGVVVAGMLSNVFFNWVFIFGRLGAPALGVEGAALGTLLARVLELLIVVCYLVFYRKKPFKLELRYILRPGATIFRDYLKYSAPVMLNETLWGLGASIYPIIYGHMAAASDVVAAHALAGNIERIITVVVFSMAHSSAVIIGTAIGSGSGREEVCGLGKTISLLSTLIGFVSGLMLILLTFVLIRPVVFPLFTMTPGAQRAAMIMLTAGGAVMLFRSFNVTLIVGILRGGGDVKFGMYLDIASMYFWSIPLGALAALVFKVDILWVYILIISEDFIKTAVGFVRFKSGKWVKNVTREMG